MKNDLKTANQIDKEVAELVRGFELGPILPHLELVGHGQVMEVKDETGTANRYYKWLACLMRLLRPRQVVELGAAAGISTIMMATQLPKSSTLYSVDIDSQAWKWMKFDYSQVTKILGDDLDMNIWDGINLLETDVWFIDTAHFQSQLRKEFELYRPFWKKGAIVVLDDIHNPELEPVWNEIMEDKCDNSVPNHYSGFGFLLI